MVENCMFDKDIVLSVVGRINLTATISPKSDDQSNQNNQEGKEIEIASFRKERDRDGNQSRDYRIGDDPFHPLMNNDRTGQSFICFTSVHFL